MAADDVEVGCAAEFVEGADVGESDIGDAADADEGIGVYGLDFVVRGFQDRKVVRRVREIPPAEVVLLVPDLEGGKPLAKAAHDIRHEWPEGGEELVAMLLHRHDAARGRVEDGQGYDSLTLGGVQNGGDAVKIGFVLIPDPPVDVEADAPNARDAH